MSTRCGRIFRRCSRRYMASRWSTWTTPPPRRSRGSVIRAMEQFYCEDCANIHRGVHELSERATDVLRVFARQGAAVPERARCGRDCLRAWHYGRRSTWWRRATDANSSAADDEIVDQRHGAPLQHRSLAMLCELPGAKLRVIPITRQRGIAAGRIRTAARSQDQVGLHRACLQCPGHRQPGAAR